MSIRLALVFLASIAVAQPPDLQRIPAGSFAATDQFTSVPVRVNLSAFQLGKTEVTQAQYEAVTGANPSVYIGPNRPVENVSWWDAIHYMNALSNKQQLRPCYDPATGKRDPLCNGYRLPTEAEWMRVAGQRPAPGQLPTLGSTDVKSTAALVATLKLGTHPVASLAADVLGLFDLYGNVSEWCDDFYDPLWSPESLRDPRGPKTGIARVVRGGSFVTTSASWSGEYRSSMPPTSRSRYKGFRIARNGSAPVPTPIDDPNWFAPFNQRPAALATAIGNLTNIPTAERDWRQRLIAKWQAILAEPPTSARPASSRLLQSTSVRNFPAELRELETEPDIWENIFVLRPASSQSKRLPVLIVPYYDVDTPAGLNLGGRRFTPPGVRSFAYIGAQHGYLVVAVRWFGESYGEFYTEAVANLALRHPGATGLGKWIADARRLVDFIETIPDADPQRIGILGHSLGGKMAIYAAAFEPRIRAVVASEPGIAFASTNYDAYWYLGEALRRAPQGTDQHELLALMAPRPALLIGGDDSDKDTSWHYINAARPAYRALGFPNYIGFYNHHSGHSPAPAAVDLAFQWFDHFLVP